MSRDEARLRPRPKIVSFSGIDGAGKSTHITALCRLLDDSSLSYSLLTFWDDIATFSRLRENLGFRVFKGDKGIGSPERPIVRRDKNVSGWFLTVFRSALYLLDVLSLRIAISRAKRSDTDFVIFDRYIYDELANLPLQWSIIRFYVRQLLRITPDPDIAFLIDADPEEAVTRKPEYPVEFVRRNREAYLSLSGLIRSHAMIPPLSLDRAIAVMTQTISERFLLFDVKKTDFPMNIRALPTS